MKVWVAGAIAVGLFLGSAAQARADVVVTMNNGHVTLVAKDATLRQILAEWARVGKTTIVNADRVSGGPMNLELTDLPEKLALDIVLRSVSGYFAAPRVQPQPNASYFDRIFVLPTPTSPRSVSSSAPPPLPRPATFQQAVEVDDAPPIPAAPAPRQPVTTTFSLQPAPGVSAAPEVGRPTSTPTYTPTYTPPTGSSSAPPPPVGASAPGVILQPPPAQPAPGRF